MQNLFFIRLKKEIETHRRIVVAVWAYAYEVMDEPVVSDATYDETAKLVDLSIDTDRPDLDKWFRENFHPDTGMWIRSHPELAGIERLYHEHYASKK